MNNNDDRNRSRDHSVDPEDRLKEISRLIAKARVEGPELLLRPLFHGLTWGAASGDHLDLAIQAVSGLLGNGWIFSEFTEWSCPLVFREAHCDVNVERSNRLATYVHLETGIEFQLLPGGRVNRWKRVEPFLIARWPVTERQFAAAHSGLRTPSVPQTNLSMSDCEDWLRAFKLNLPTPLQWEYACRASTTTDYYWGNAPNPAHMWTRENAMRAIDPSINEAKKNWNAFGLVDTIGNVWELAGEEDSAGFYRRFGLSYRSQREMAPFHPSLTRTIKRPDTGFRPVFNLSVKIRLYF